MTLALMLFLAGDAWMSGEAVAVPVVLQDKGTEKDEDAESLRKKLEEQRKRRTEMEKKQKEAIERKDWPAVEQQFKESQKVDQEIDQIEKRLVKLDDKTFSYEYAAAAPYAILTHWDNDLELGDLVGFGIGVHLVQSIGFEYRRWEPEDDLGNDDAVVQSYHIGFAWKSLIGALLDIAATVGLVRFTSGAPGAHNDTGPIFSLSPRVTYPVSQHGFLSAGVTWDALRTSFNQNHTHTNHNLSAFVGFTIGF